MIDQYRGLLQAVSTQYPLLELALVHHRNTRAMPITFGDKPFLIEPYADAGQLDSWVVRKAVQTGWSEWGIQWALERAGWRGRIVAYVLPTYTVRDRFVQQRIDPLLMDVPAYRERTPGNSSSIDGKRGAGNMRLKRFGAGSLMFLGSNTEVDFVEFSADALIVDEYDQCDPTNLAKARDRVRASPYAQMLRVGNPTMPRTGIARLYDESDGRRWFHRCSCCGCRQPIDWFLNVVERADDGWVPRDRERWRALQGTQVATLATDLRPVCRRCKKPWTRRIDGSCWVAERPAKVMRGYTCSRLDVLSDSLWALYGEWLAAQASPIALSTFYCSILGLPYEFFGARITTADLEAAACGPATDWDGGAHLAKSTVTCGVDVGAVLHVTIDVIEGHNEAGDPQRRSIYVGSTRTFEEVKTLLEKYRVTVCVIDAAPELHKSQELRDACLADGSCSVWLARFGAAPKQMGQKYGIKLDYQHQVITVDRTSVFDVAFEDINSGRRTFPGDVFGILGWKEQMEASVRVLDVMGGRVVWTEGNAADHYRLSDIYARMAYDLLQVGGTYSSSGEPSRGSE